MSRRNSAGRKPIPRFASEAAERRFWAEHDTTEYFDWSQAVEASFPNLKPSTTAISLRLPVTMLEELKALANATGVPYQSLLKVFLSDRLARERVRRTGKKTIRRATPGGDRIGVRQPAPGCA